MSRGFLIYALNNEEIDYGQMALVCAAMIKNHLKINRVCLATDQSTLNWVKSNYGELFERMIDDVVLLHSSTNDQKKAFKDSASTTKILSWKNQSRASAYELSPYDETVVLDSDFLVQDPSFDLVWGNDESVMINKDIALVSHTEPAWTEKRLDKSGLEMYWATAIYFKKDDVSKTLFNLVEHIRERYDFYQYAYEFPGRLFRNDYAFSIAIHMLNGFLQNGEIKPLPFTRILSSFDTDELVDVGPNSLTFLTSSREKPNDYTLTKVEGVSVHVMNKYSIGRMADKLISIYDNH